MHRVETTYETIFDQRNRPLEGKYACDAWGKEQVYLATEYLRYRNWKGLDTIGKVYLRREYGLWYIGKFKKGELYESLALPVIDEERSQGDWLAILIAARRTGLPFRAYAKAGSWDFWRRYDARFIDGLEPQGVRGHQADLTDDAGTAVASAESEMLSGRPSYSGSPSTLKRGERSLALRNSEHPSDVEGWGTSHTATEKASGW